MAATLWLAAATAGQAHDSWLVPAPSAAPGEIALEMSTGVRFPVQETGPSAASVSVAQCGDGRGNGFGLEPVERSGNSLLLRATPSVSRLPVGCIVELNAFDIELTPALVETYLKEIRASDSVRQAWNTLRARGVPWRESYRKFARIQLDTPSAALPHERSASRAPSGLDMDLVLLGDEPAAAKQPLHFLLMRDGKPLVGLPVEFVSERSRFGVWATTDVQGHIEQALPFAGRWLLRATDLRLAADGQRWESRFVTLSIELR